VSEEEKEVVMNDRRPVRIFIHQSQTTRYYDEQETASLAHLSVQVVQQLCADGLIEGVEVAGEQRRYSEEDVALLRRFWRIQRDLEVNEEGAQVIVRLLKRLKALQSEIESYRRHE
jgi:DNA-binding transcriptional MerR regulator